MRLLAFSIRPQSSRKFSDALTKLGAATGVWSIGGLAARRRLAPDVSGHRRWNRLLRVLARTYPLDLKRVIVIGHSPVESWVCGWLHALA